MTLTRPYLLRALHEWMVDNGLTPHLLVDAKVDGVEVPQQYIENDKIVLNVIPNAVRDLDIGNDYLSFSARFAGKPRQILTSINAVLAIYAKENGKGMVFPEDDNNRENEQDEPVLDNPPVKNKPNLTIIK
jgi:stringent starvation protein B